MADLNTTIAEFLRDAQYRIAEISGELVNMKKRRPEYEDLFYLRAQLIMWMDCLYEGRDNVYGDPFNYLTSGVGWTDSEIIGECEYLRQISGMNDIAYLSFAGYSPSIANLITGIGGDLPAGLENYYIRYDVNGNPVSEPFPNTGGMTTETIDQYFS